MRLSPPLGWRMRREKQRLHGSWPPPRQGDEQVAAEAERGHPVEGLTRGLLRPAQWDLES